MDIVNKNFSVEKVFSSGYPELPMAQLPNQISVAAAAEMLKISKVRVREYINAGRLPAQKVGNYFVLKSADVIAFRPMPRGRPKAKK